MTSLFDAGAPAPCPSPFNMAAHVLAHAQDQADKIALSVISGDTSNDWTYAQMQRAVLGTGTGLLAKGFKPGDILLMRLDNTVEFPIAYLGAIAAGLVPVPTSSMLTAEEVAKMIAQISPAGILRDPGVACPEDIGLPQIATPELSAMHDLPPCAYDMGDPERLAYIIFTSGTSGQPRAVCHAHRAIWARRMMHEGWYALRGDDRLLHAGAFNWTFTLGTGLMDPWTVGATALIPEPGTAPEALPALLAAHEATLFAAAPGVYRKLLKQSGPIELPHLRHGLAAGEKLSETIRAEWNAATGTRIYEAYGMSECSTFISGNPAHPARPGCLGRPQTGRRIAILDEDSGAVQPLGQEGVIAVHRSDPGLMLGYFGAPEETEARFKGEWFLTGDHGIMHEDFQIEYAGRGDDMMNAGGYRVSPLEVEATLIQHPQIAEIGCTDIEIKPGVAIIAAFYVAAADPNAADLDKAALDGWAAEHLARYKQPRAWIRLDHLPTNPNGKLSRKALRALYPAAG